MLSKHQEEYSSYLLGIVFNLKDGASVFIWNVGKHLPDYITSCARRKYSSGGIKINIEDQWRATEI